VLSNLFRATSNGVGTARFRGIQLIRSRVLPLILNLDLVEREVGVFLP